MSPFQYLSEEWRAEAERRLKAELTPERMNNITSSMSNVYLDCPGGGSKYLLFRFENGALTELRRRPSSTSPAPTTSSPRSHGPSWGPRKPS